MESLRGTFKLRSLEMLAYKEMKNLEFPFAQDCSNDCVLSQHSTSSLSRGWGYIGFPNSYGK